MVADPEDRGGLAERLKELLSDPAGSVRLGEAGRKAVETLTREANGRRVEEIYRAVSAEKKQEATGAASRSGG
jgi:hypothetical protein